MIRALTRLGLASLVAAAVLSAGRADAARVALVIGNDTYQQLTPLQKAVADAEDFAATLKSKGYTVIQRINATRTDMDFAIGDFLAAVGPGDTAVFFYSGHGWSDGSQNFLVGTDAPKKASEAQLARISISLAGILADIEERKASLKVAIVDACRDNPFSSTEPGRSVGRSRGLVRVVDPPEGTFVVFSAGTGQTALDRLSDDDPHRNSVFTRTFLPYVRDDIWLHEAIKASQTTVKQVASPHLQSPAYYDQVSGNACLSEKCQSIVVAAVESKAEPEPAPRSPATEGGNVVLGQDVQYWMVIQNSTNPYDFKLFRDAFPDSQLAILLASRRMEELEADYWKSKEDAGSASELDEYLQVYPDGAHAGEAKTRLAALRQSANAEQRWREVENSQNISELEAFVDEFPNIPLAADARQRIAELKAAEAEESLWARLEDSQNAADIPNVENYLQTYPDGRFAPDAKEKLSALRKLLDEEQQWRAIEVIAAPAEIKEYLEDNPTSKFADEARARLEEINAKEAQAWGRIENSQRPEDYDLFLTSFPDGTHAADAKQRLALLRPPELTGRELYVALQEALKAVGCYTARVDGDWGPRSNRALEEFRRHANVSGLADPSSEFLEKVRSYDERVCPEVVVAPPPPPKKQRATPRPPKRQAPAPAIRRQPPPPPPPVVERRPPSGGSPTILP